MGSSMSKKKGGALHGSSNAQVKMSGPAKPHGNKQVPKGGKKY